MRISSQRNAHDRHGAGCFSFNAAFVATDEEVENDADDEDTAADS